MILNVIYYTLKPHPQKTSDSASDREWCTSGGCGDALVNGIPERDKPLTDGQQACSLHSRASRWAGCGDPRKGAYLVLRGDTYRWGGKSQAFCYMWAGKLDWTLDEPQIKSKQITWPHDGPLTPGIVLRKPQRGGSGKHVGFLELSHRGWCQGPAGVDARALLELKPRWTNIDTMLQSPSSPSADKINRFGLLMVVAQKFEAWAYQRWAGSNLSCGPAQPGLRWLWMSSRWSAPHSNHKTGKSLLSLGKRKQNLKKILQISKRSNLWKTLVFTIVVNFSCKIL